MKAILLAAALLLLPAYAGAQGRACGAAVADGVTTAAALSTGNFVEGNPLLPGGIGGAVLVTGIKCGMAYYASTMPEPARTDTLTTQESVFGAAAVYNLLMIAGQPHLAIVAGVGYGLYSWQTTAPDRQAVRDMIEQLRLTNEMQNGHPAK